MIQKDFHFIVEACKLIKQFNDIILAAPITEISTWRLIRADHP